MSAADRWDARYAATEAPFGDAPNDWLVTCVQRWRIEHGRMPASALLLADGDGRNGTWLATQGVAVDALDASPLATRQAHLRDQAAGVSVRREVADLAQWQAASTCCVELVAIIYLQAERAVRRRAVRQAMASLAPGGWLALEGFAARGMAAPRYGLGPATDDRRYAAGELRDWVAGCVPCVVHRCETLSLTLDEGRRHRGPAQVVRLLTEARGGTVPRSTGA